MARDLQDAMKWNILFQLLTHIPALSGPDDLSSFHFAERNAKVLEKFVERVVFAKHREFATSELGENDIGGILISFDELKKNPELRRKLAEEFVMAHNGLLTLEAKRRMEEAVDKAISAAEKIAERKVPYYDEFGKRKFKQVFESPEDIYKIPELVEFLKVVEEVVPKDVLKEPLSKSPSELKKIEPEKPTYSIVKEHVEEKLEAKGISASQVTFDLTNTKLEILSILQALEFADYSESAKRKAIEKISSKIDELSRETLTKETALKLGLLTFALEILKRSEFERAKEIKEL